MKCVFAKIFLGLYVLALALFLVGRYGWFGQEQDPLSGIFLLPLGLPWNLFLLSGASDAALLFVGVFSPLINLILIVAICRRVRRA